MSQAECFELTTGHRLKSEGAPMERRMGHHRGDPQRRTVRYSDSGAAGRSRRAEKLDIRAKIQKYMYLWYTSTCFSVFKIAVPSLRPSLLNSRILCPSNKWPQPCRECLAERNVSLRSRVQTINRQALVQRVPQVPHAHANIGMV